jgi:hypothetical protein
MEDMSMNTPSLKALQEAFSQWLTLDQLREIKTIMQSPSVKVNGQTRMERIDKILGTHGVEYVPQGKGANSPPFYYCNSGDTYAVTIIKIRGRFRIGTWGDIVERGRYE